MALQFVVDTVVAGCHTTSHKSHNSNLQARVEMIIVYSVNYRLNYRVGSTGVMGAGSRS